MPEVDITTAGVKVPATLMHLHAVTITVADPPSVDDIRDVLAEEPRLLLVPRSFAAEGCGSLREVARDAARPRGDLPENGIWTESITSDGTDICLFQAIHQESVVVPENVDAIRAITNAETAETSRRRTNESLGLGRLDRAAPLSSPIG